MSWLWIQNGRMWWQNYSCVCRCMGESARLRVLVYSTCASNRRARERECVCNNNNLMLAKHVLHLACSCLHHSWRTHTYTDRMDYWIESATQMGTHKHIPMINCVNIKCSLYKFAKAIRNSIRIFMEWKAIGVGARENDGQKESKISHCNATLIRSRTLLQVCAYPWPCMWASVCLSGKLEVFGICFLLLGWISSSHPFRLSCSAMGWLLFIAPRDKDFFFFA